MSNIITTRDPDIIAAEINTIKREVRETVIFASIKIGQKLTEAKSLVNHGEWGKWLEENVEYSQSTANYLMQLYQEYGTGQESLFDTWTTSQTFAKLTYSQHIALLALPFGERQEFAEQNNVAEMSTRQLQQAIRERDDAMKAKQDIEAQLDTAGDKILELEAQLRNTNQTLLDAQQVAAAAKSDEGAWKQKFEKLNSDKARAEQSEANALKLVNDLKKQLKDAQAAEKEAREDLKKAQENPEIPGAMLEQLRAEVEAQTAEKAAVDIQKKLEAANISLAKAEAQAREAEEKLAAAQKQMKMADQNMMAVQTLGTQLLSLANSINGHRMKAIMQDEANAKPINKYLIYILEELRTAFGIKAESKTE